MNTAIYVGSFDLLTWGHIDIIDQGVNLFERLIVMVANNADKKHLFPLEDRQAALVECLNFGTYISDDGKRGIIFEPEESKRIEIITLDEKKDGYAVKHAQNIGATHYIRGIRDARDYHFEDHIFQINNEISHLRPVWLPAHPKLRHVSSSVVKSLIGPKGWERTIHQYVPPPVYHRLIAMFNGEVIQNLMGEKA